MPSIGDPAPDFELESDAGDRVRLSDLRGQRVVLYFYPKDDTPGCTRQAIALRDSWAAIEATGARLFGISPDDSASHTAFREKFSLPFTLLADPGHEAIGPYDAWVERERDGERFMGLLRSTYIVDEEGAISHRWRPVDPDEHLSLLTDALGA